MKAHQSEFSLERMARMLEVTRGGYHRYIKAEPSNRAQSNARLTEKICGIFEASRRTYGSPRLHRVLRSEGESCSRKRVARLMQQAGLAAARRGGSR